MADVDYGNSMTKRFIKQCKQIVLYILKFLYGYLFGMLLWWIMIEPYGQYLRGFSREASNQLPKVIFCTLMAIAMMTIHRVRVVMVLFLPSLFATATQNYVTIAIFITLITHPIYSVAMNASESVRVIGCSLILAYEKLRDQVELILNPILALLDASKRTNMHPFENSLLQMEELILQLRKEANFSIEVTRSLLENNEKIQLNQLKSEYEKPPSKSKIAQQIKTKLEASKDTKYDPLNNPVDDKLIQTVASKARELIKGVKLKLEDGTVKFVADINIEEYNRKRREKLKELSKHLQQNLNGSNSDEFNLSNMLYNSCINVFDRAKLSCGHIMEEMYTYCSNKIGSFLATIWCSPLTSTFKYVACPKIMDDLLDEVNSCKAILNVTQSLTTGGLGLDRTYAELRKQVVLMANDTISEANDDIKGEEYKRIELNIELNSATAKVFFQAKSMFDFLTDKYRMRDAIAKFILFLYDLYTSLTFLCILRKAANYRKQYLESIRFDNYYITRQFLRLDSRRRLQKKHTILPLTKEEREKYIIGTFSCSNKTQEERQVSSASWIVLALFLFWTFSILYADNVFYYILKSIHDHALIQFNEQGQHNFIINVNGDGSLARLVSKLTSRLNSISRLKRQYNTDKCLPEPTQTSRSTYLKLLYLFILYCLIDLIAIEAMRLRRITAALFYPAKERDRIKFLYNRIMLERQIRKSTAGPKKQQLGSKEALELDPSEFASDDAEKDVDEDSFFSIRQAIIYLANCFYEEGFKELIVRSGINTAINAIGFRGFSRQTPRMSHYVIH